MFMPKSIDAARPESTSDSQELRARVIASAAKLISAGGRDAATTREVAAAAGVQAPTIYRLFGDKHGLLAAVAADAIARYVAQKAQRKTLADPVEELIRSWSLHTAFCLENPHLFAIMEMGPQDGPVRESLEIGLQVLRTRIRAIALAGRLTVTEERALAMIRAAGSGTVLGLLQQPEGRRDKGLLEATQKAVLAAITTERCAALHGNTRAHAVALTASLDEIECLSPGERQLMRELLERITIAGS